MKLYTAGGLSLIALTFLYTQTIFAGDTPPAESEPTDKPPTPGFDKSYRNYKEGVFSIQPPLLYSSLDNERYSFFVYSLSDDDKNLLMNPNGIDKILFNDNPLEFEYKAKLPSYPISSMTVYTCKESNNPILVSLSVPRKHFRYNYYYYKQDPNTQKWANCKIASLRESQKVDGYGLIYYRFKKEDAVSTFYSYLAEACPEIPRESGDIEDDFEEARELEEPTLEILLGGRDSHAPPARAMGPDSSRETESEVHPEERSDEGLTSLDRDSSHPNEPTSTDKEEATLKSQEEGGGNLGSHSGEQPKKQNRILSAICPCVKKRRKNKKSESKPELYPEEQPASNTNNPPPIEEEEGGNLGSHSGERDVEIASTGPIPKIEDIPFYHYTFDKEYRAVLKSPNTLLNVKFNGDTLPFDDDSKLPTQSISSFKVFACLHNNPILIMARGAFGYVLYSPDPANGKWKNYELESLKEYEALDKKGTKYYKSDSDDTSKSINNIIEDKLPQLCVSLCKGDKCKNNTTLAKPSIDVSVQLDRPPKENNGPAREGTSQTKFVPVIKLDPNATRLLDNRIPYYHYIVNNVHRRSLCCPNKIESIKFNENTLEFAPDAKLPTYRVLTIIIYTCPHNYPLLVRFHGLYQYTFYSRDNKSNKWEIKAFDSLKACQKQDDDGSLYYVFYKEDEIKSMYNKILKECLKESKSLCAKHRAEGVSLLEGSVIEIKLKR